MALQILLAKQMRVENIKTGLRPYALCSGILIVVRAFDICEDGIGLTRRSY